jgi:WD40 repeat protein
MLCSLIHEVNLQLIDITRTEVLCRFTGGVQDVEAMDLSDDPERLISKIKFSNDSQYIAWTGADGQLHIGPMSLESEEILNIDLKGHGHCLAWSPDDKFVFVGGRFDDVLEVEVSSGSQRSLMTHAAHPMAMTFDPHRSRLITGHKDGTLRFIDPATCDLTQVLQFHDVKHSDNRIKSERQNWDQYRRGRQLSSLVCRDGRTHWEAGLDVFATA